MADPKEAAAPRRVVDPKWVRDLTRHIGSGEQAFETVTTEPYAVTEALRAVGRKALCPVVTWDIAEGFQSNDVDQKALDTEIGRISSPRSDTPPYGHEGLDDPTELRHPLAALKATALFRFPWAAIRKECRGPQPAQDDTVWRTPALFVFYNFFTFFDDPAARQVFENMAKTNLLNSQECRRPIHFVQSPFGDCDIRGMDGVRHWMLPIEFALPTEEELLAGMVAEVAHEVMVAQPGAAAPDDELLKGVATGLIGLEGHRADCLLRFVVSKCGGITERVPKLIRRKAAEHIAKSGTMDIVQDHELTTPDQLGGVRRILADLEDAADTFSDDARELCMDPARGVALCGLPGSGKTTIAAAMPELFRRRTGRPWTLVRTKVGAFYGGILGDTERNWYDFERREEALGYRIILIDEFDAFAGVGDAQGLDEARKSLFKMMTAWASRAARGGGRFVIYAMNDPTGLPPEALREGRTDATYFFDFPMLGARIDIAKIHYRKRMKAMNLGLGDLGLTDAQWLAIGQRTRDWLPGEIEGLVKRSRQLAFRARRAGVPTFDEISQVIEVKSPAIDAIKKRDQIAALRDACKDALPVDDRDDTAASTIVRTTRPDGAARATGRRNKGLDLEPAPEEE
jgi:hypothetical protein